MLFDLYLGKIIGTLVKKEIIANILAELDFAGGFGGDNSFQQSIFFIFFLNYRQNWKDYLTGFCVESENSFSESAKKKLIFLLVG